MLKAVVTPDDYSGLTSTVTSSSAQALTLKDVEEAYEKIQSDHYADAAKYLIMNGPIKEAMEADFKYNSFKEPYYTTPNPLARAFNPLADGIANNVNYL